MVWREGLKGKPTINTKPSFIELERRIEWAPAYREKQLRNGAIKGIVCHLEQMVVHEGEVVTIS